MAQILDPVPSDGSDVILCCYVNATSQMQIARITNVPNWYFERVVFPGQRLVFEAIADAHLEIHTGMMASAILSDHIPCVELSVNDTISTISITETTQEKKDYNPTLSPVNHKIIATPEPLTTSTLC